MEIEVVAFYTDERCDEQCMLRGSMHVYLIDIQVDLRGIGVTKKDDNWHFSNQVIKVEGKIDTRGKPMVYPVFNFMDHYKNMKMMETIKTKGIEYIEREILSKTEDELLENI